MYFLWKFMMNDFQIVTFLQSTLFTFIYNIFTHPFLKFLRLSQWLFRLLAIKISVKYCARYQPFEIPLWALRILRKHNSSYNFSHNSPFASSAGFLSTLRGRASLTNALRELTHFSNYAATTVAELKRAKELSLINLDAGRVRADLDSRCSCACRKWREWRIDRGWARVVEG